MFFVKLKESLQSTSASPKKLALIFFYAKLLIVKADKRLRWRRAASSLADAVFVDLRTKQFLAAGELAQRKTTSLGEKSPVCSSSLVEDKRYFYSP